MFSAEFAAAKAEKNRLDFADLEHLALRLLVEKQGGKYLRTAQAAEISRRYEHVLVDEYQDTNEVQDLIFVSVSRQQANLFMVGDVKQSIYAFRQAMPEIFIARRKAAFPYATGMFPAKINLDMNFRSRKEVTEAVNFLFGRLMSEQLGDVDYNGGESLKCGAAYPDYDGAQAELMLTGLANYGGERDAVELEAAAVAEKIAGMLESGYMVAEKGSMRPAEPRDFCILLRAPKNRAPHYIKELGLRGIPAWAEGAAGYLAAREVSAALSVLKAVDNPLRDIELVAAMMSPYFGFNSDDIANIRLAKRGVPFYAALCEAAGENEKAAGFLKAFAELRSLSAFMPADKLIMRFYDMTSALAIARAMKNGEARVKNLRLLAEYAADFHRLGYKQLGGFVQFIDRLEEQGQDLAPASLIGDGANVVRVMSAHRSKGLEFPVVILAGTGHAFNKQDLRAAFLLHSEYGFACVRRDPARRVQFPTAPLMSVRLESERTLLSEEMRILYVALTRAREKLIVSACYKQDLRKKISSLAQGLENGRLPASALRDLGCLADWIISAVSGEDAGPWEITVNEPESDMAPATQAAKEPDAVRFVLDTAEPFAYPFEAAARIPAKMAVSSVAGAESALRYRFSARPKFMAEQKLTPAEQGNAMHKFMQFASYAAARDDLEAEIARMAGERFLSQAEAESLSRPRLRAFFSSGLARRIFASGDFRRELRFMAECGRELLGETIPQGEPEAKVVLQGVADCVFFERGEAIVVDYKTDYVKDANALLERYSRQLELYAALLGGSLGANVKECVIYSFALSKAIILPNRDFVALQNG
jgi:ATP-dependent helicase/nuclease subunit A